MNISKEFLNITARHKDLTTYHYRIMLLLLERERTQSQISQELDINKQNINKACKDLESLGIIYVSRQEGQMKYLKVDVNLKKLEMKGQLKL